MKIDLLLEKLHEAKEKLSEATNFAEAEVAMKDIDSYIRNSDLTTASKKQYCEAIKKYNLPGAAAQEKLLPGQPFINKAFQMSKDAITTFLNEVVREAEIIKEYQTNN